MKLFSTIFSLFFVASIGLADNVKISQLPLGSGALVGSSDSFPYVQASNLVTKRLTIYDLVNVPQFVATYAPINNPTFTGTVTAPVLVSPLITATTVKASGSGGVVFQNSSLATVLTVGSAPAAATVSGDLSVSGNVTGTWNGTTISVAKGGTGLTAQGTQYQVFQAGASSPQYAAVALNQAAAVTGVLPNSNTTATSSNTASAIVARDGSGNFTAGTITASVTGTSSGNTTYTPNQYGVVLSGSANAMSVLAPVSSTAYPLVSGGVSANPSWALLTIAGGGTGAATKSAAFDALSPMTSSGDLTYGGASGTGTRLAIGSTGNVLTVSGGVPVWSAPTAGNPAISSVKTTTYAILSTDYTVQTDASGGAFTITLPTAVGVTGQVYVLKKIIGDTSWNIVTIATTSAQTIDGTTTRTLGTRGESITVQSDGSNWVILNRQWDMRPQQYTPTANGLGGTWSCLWSRRSAQSLHVNCWNGSVSPNGSQAEIYLPSGASALTFTTTLSGRPNCGYANRSNSSAGTYVLCQSGNAYFQFANVGSNNSAGSGSSILGGGESMGFFGDVEIQQWL